QPAGLKVVLLSACRAPLVTAHSTVAEPAPTIPTPAPAPLSFPLRWLVRYASAPIKNRSMTEVARTAEPTSPEFDWLPYSHRPAIRLAVTQTRDGMWNQSVLSLPGRHATDFANIGTIPAVRRLSEYGWGRGEHPPGCAPPDLSTERRT